MRHVEKVPRHIVAERIPEMDGKVTEATKVLMFVWSLLVDLIGEHREEELKEEMNECILAASKDLNAIAWKHMSDWNVVCEHSYSDRPCVDHGKHIQVHLKFYVVQGDIN